MRFSYVMLPDYPLAESLQSIRLADELGFYACYAADETWHKDLWLLFAAAAFHPDSRSHKETRQLNSFSPHPRAMTISYADDLALPGSGTTTGRVKRTP